MIFLIICVKILDEEIPLLITITPAFKQDWGFLLYKENKMAVTLPDVTSSGTLFTNVYTATGLAVGTKLIIQNKASNPMYFQIKSTQPAASSVDGNIITSYEFIIIDGGDIPGVWVKGAGKISVQVFD